MALLRSRKYDFEKPLAIELLKVLGFENKFTPGAWKNYIGCSCNVLQNEQNDTHCRYIGEHVKEGVSTISQRSAIQSGHQLMAFVSCGEPGQAEV
jgi:hypothetical protein